MTVMIENSQIVNSNVWLVVFWKTYVVLEQMYKAEICILMFHAEFFALMC